MVRNPASNSLGLAQAQLWLARIGAFALPLVVLWSTNDQVILPKLLAARALMVILAALLIVRWARGELKIRRTPLDLPILAYVISAGVSTAFAANPNLALFGAYGRSEGLLTIATYGALFWLTAQSVAGPAEARSVLRALLAGAFVVSLMAIGQAVAITLTAPPSGESATGFGGVARAVGTFGNANALAAYLAMAIPLAVNEFLQVKTFQDRLLAGNMIGVTTIALVLTFGRGAWVGALVGVAVVLGIRRPSPRRVAVAAGVVVGVVAVIAVLLALLGAGGPQIVQSTAARLASRADPRAGSGAARLHIWKDTLAMIASRPITGYGPDNFGLVFPQFQTGPWAGSQIIDESHSELLQVGATQGLIGIAAFGWLCFAFLRMCWNRRENVFAGAVLGAGAAFLITNLVNFSVVPAALQFWLFLGAGTVLLQVDEGPEAENRVGRRARLPLAVSGLVALAAVSVVAIALPYVGDTGLREGLNAFAAGDTGRASRLVSEAGAVQPQQALYAAVAGNLSMAGGDWAAARDAYMRAARLGSFDPSVYRQLAIADEHLGLQAEAVAAARRSVELGGFDSRNRAVLAEVLGQSAAP
jgi:putative inorganic carbon (HCO3(-)) transporter